MTMEIIIFSGSHWKMKDSTTLILVKGKQLSAGESSKAFTFATNLIQMKSKCIAFTGSSQCLNCHLGWNLHTVLVLTILWELLSNFGGYEMQTADLQIYFSRFWWRRFGFFCMMYYVLLLEHWCVIIKLDISNGIIIVNRYVKVIDFMQRIKLNLCQTFPLWWVLCKSRSARCESCSALHNSRSTWKATRLVTYFWAVSTVSPLMPAMTTGTILSCLARVRSPTLTFDMGLCAFIGLGIPWSFLFAPTSASLPHCCHADLPVPSLWPPGISLGALEATSSYSDSLPCLDI